MAQRTRIDLIDDIDGTTADETMMFSVDGIGYEIDLSERNAATFRNAFARYISAGRKVSGSRRRAGRKAADGEATVIRAWAQAQGLTVSTRGRVSAEIRKAYEIAHR